MMHADKYSYLIVGSPREQLADALLEYRAFVAANPESELSLVLTDVSRKVRTALRDKRHVMRATGDPGKANAHCKFTVEERRDLAQRRHARFASAQGQLC